MPTVGERRGGGKPHDRLSDVVARMSLDPPPHLLFRSLARHRTYEDAVTAGPVGRFHDHLIQMCKYVAPILRRWHSQVGTFGILGSSPR